jgi:hypothetical protein
MAEKRTSSKGMKIVFQPLLSTYSELIVVGNFQIIDSIIVVVVVAKGT